MATAVMPPRKILNVPAVAPAHYSRNFIRQAVCELRFPTLLELEQHSPVQFSKAIRKEYPTYNLLKDLQLSSVNVAQANAHSFKSKNHRWTVTVRAAAISIETSNYDSYTEFQQRVAYVIKAAVGTIDSDFFTRVGLRYINTVPFEADTISDWVNPALTGPLSDGVLGSVDQYWHVISGPTNVGGYTFQHGVAARKNTPSENEYALDFDFFREDVPVADVPQVLGELHALEFSMFHWALGTKGRESLGPSDLR